MDQFPSNSKRPARARDEPRKVERVVTGDVVRRKTPLGRRVSQNLFGGDVQNVGDHVVGDILIPAARNMMADAVIGFVERMLFPNSSPGRLGGNRSGPIPYHRYSAPTGRREDPRREISRRGRATHSFDEIILERRVEADEVLDRMYHTLNQFQEVCVADLYEMVGISSNYIDRNWGWTDLQGAYVSHVRNGYLLNLPKPEPLDR